MIVDVVFKNERAVGGAFILQALGVLDEQGNAFQCAGLETTLHVVLFNCLGLAQGLIKIAVGETVDFFVQLLTAID